MSQNKSKGMHGTDSARLEELRRRMDVITEEMTRLLLERGSIASEIGKEKNRIGKEITDEEREVQLWQKITKLCTEDECHNISSLDNRMVARFLNFLINESAMIQSKETGGKNETHLSVFARAKELERKGKKIIHMEVGEPDFMPSRTVRDALASAYDTGRTKYGGPRGNQELCGALAAFATEKYCAADSTLSSENIIVTPGGRFAVFAAMTTLLSPGDEVIIMEPAWPAYRDCAEHAGAKVRAIHTTLENQWTPEISQINQVANSNTKMIIINYPNNPTGRVLPQDVMDGIMKTASHHNMYVLSDEIYSGYTEKPWKSAISYNHKRTIAVQSFSKSHAMTGLRIGYAMSHDTGIIDAMASLAALCLTSVSTPIQHAALASINTDTTPNTVKIASRLNGLAKRAGSTGLEFAVPDGGMYIFARLPEHHAGMISGEELARTMLEEHGVAIAPGTGFGPYPQYVRISVAGADSDRLNEGTDKLTSVMSRMIDDRQR